MGFEQYQDRAIITIHSDGPRGPQGIQGPKGDKGDPGEVTQVEFDNLSQEVTSFKEDYALLPNKKKIDLALQEWEAKSHLIHIGGRPETTWLNNGSFSKGYTALMPTYAFCQNGKIHTIKIKGTGSIGQAQLKIKIFRYNYSTSMYDFIDERSATVTISSTFSATYSVVLSTPMDVKIGDIPSVYMDRVDGGTWTWLLSKTGKTALSNTLLALGDITTSNQFTSSSESCIQLDCLGLAPLLAFTGDSIFEGHNTAEIWHGRMDDAITTGTKTIPGGVITSEPGFMTVFNHSSIIGYQNLASGGQTFAWVASKGMLACLAIKPHTIVILCGVNDVLQGRTWEQIEIDLNTIKTAFLASVSERLMFCEILPWTAGTDAQSDIIRKWNTNLDVWCRNNGATLIKTHDKMGQIRTSTRNFDDLKTAYNFDGVHLTTDGVAELGKIIYDALIS